MRLPIELPIEPMLARLVDEIPEADAIPGGYAYEPKWDGFRCVVLRDGAEIELSSRGKRMLTRYFPEVVEHIGEVLPQRCIMDAELVVRSGTPGAQHLDWEALSQRIHPAASRVRMLSNATPAELVCFDLLALDDSDLTALPYDERRGRLEAVFAGTSASHGIHLTRTTLDAAEARMWLREFEGAGLDGVVAKPRRDRYVQGKRTMLKIKHKRTAEAVVIGYRKHAKIEGVGSLLLGMYDDEGTLIGVGGIGAFSEAMRVALLKELQPLVTLDASGHPQQAEKPRSRFASADDAVFVPLRPELVVEVAFDQLEGRRFRHTVQLVRWRPDREPESCLISQVDVAARYDLAQVLSR